MHVSWVWRLAQWVVAFVGNYWGERFARVGEGVAEPVSDHHATLCEPEPAVPLRRDGSCPVPAVVFVRAPHLGPVALHHGGVLYVNLQHFIRPAGRTVRFRGHVRQRRLHLRPLPVSPGRGGLGSQLA